MGALLPPPWVTPAHGRTDCYGERITSPDGGEESGYFSSVAIDGRFAVVGERGDDNQSEVDVGAAYIYEFDSGWVYNHKVLPDDSTDISNAQFGESVSIDGDYLVMTGPRYNVDVGAAQLFQRNSSDVWEYVTNGLFEPNNSQQNQAFGGDAGRHQCVSNDGRSVIVVGAYNYEGASSGQGRVYLYTYNSGSGMWDTSTLSAASPQAGENFGNAVSIDGNVLAVGAPGKDVSGATAAGVAYVYRKVSGVWTLEQTLQAGTPTASDHFGYSVAIDGNYIIVGAYANNPANAFAAVFKYDSQASPVWQQVGGDLTVSGMDGFGFSVEIDAGRAIVGDVTFANPQEPSSTSGAVFLWQRDQYGDWIFQMGLFPICAEADDNDQFGNSVAISGDDVFIGAARDTATVTGEGTTYIFTDVPSCSGETECP
jgi:hypothetical protein